MVRDKIVRVNLPIDSLRRDNQSPSWSNDFAPRFADPCRASNHLGLRVCGFLHDYGYGVTIP